MQVIQTYLQGKMTFEVLLDLDYQKETLESIAEAHQVTIERRVKSRLKWKTFRNNIL